MTFLIYLAPTGPLVLGCPSNNIEYEINSGETNVIGTWTEPFSPIPGTPVYQSHSPGSPFQRGATVVSYTFGTGMDLSVCAFLVEVRDGEYNYIVAK